MKDDYNHDQPGTRLSHWTFGALEQVDGFQASSRWRRLAAADLVQANQSGTFLR